MENYINCLESIQNINLQDVNLQNIGSQSIQNLQNIVSQSIGSQSIGSQSIGSQNISVQDLQNMGLLKPQSETVQDLQNMGFQNVTVQDIRDTDFQTVQSINIPDLQNPIYQNLNPAGYEDPLIRFAGCVSHLNGTCTAIADESSRLMKFIVEATSINPEANVNFYINKYLSNHAIMMKHHIIAENYGIMVEYEPEEYKEPLKKLVNKCIELQKERVMVMYREMHKECIHSLWKFHKPTWER